MPVRIRHLFLGVVTTLFAIATMVVPAGAQTSYSFAEGVEYEILVSDPHDPLFIQVADDGRVFWAEREGRIAVLHPDGTEDVAAYLPVSANACDETWCSPLDTVPLEEGGLYSFLLAPDFIESGELYAWRSIPGSANLGDQDAVPGNAWGHGMVCFERTCELGENSGVWRLSRFTLDADSHMIEGSEVELFEVPVHWLHCCHYGGNLEWLPDGTILLQTGDDLSPLAATYGQTTDVMEGDGEWSSMNPADRRGKVLRLNADGSVPDGSVEGVVANPFLITDDDGVALRDADGHVITQETEHTTITDTWGADDGMIAYDPYVYTRGYKQPFRGAVHPYTGTAIVSDVSPDGYAPNPARGPRGQEDIHEIPYGGGLNHGWPRCIGNNEAYLPYTPIDGAPAAPIVGSVPIPTSEPFDCSDMDPAVMWYPHDVSTEWNVFGVGPQSSTPSTFYRADNDGPLRLPESFNDNLIFMDKSRGSIMGIPMTADGHLVTDESLFTIIIAGKGSIASALQTDPTASRAVNPIDATVGPDGALYLVEYNGSFYNGTGSKISRFKCEGCTDSLSEALGQPSQQTTATAQAGLPTPIATGAGLIVAVLGALAVRRRQTLV